MQNTEAEWLRLDQSPGALVAHATRLLTQALTLALQPLNLAPAQFKLLVLLWQEDGLTQRDLVQRLDIEQSTVGNTLNRMERDGLIERHPHPLDGRAQIIQLTPRGHRLKKPAMEATWHISKNAMAGFSPAEKQKFFELMNKFVATLKQEV